MERINKFLDARQKKHIKTVKYKDEKFQITKEDLKKVRAYKSSRCLDPSLKTIPNRIIDTTTLPAMPSKIKKDYSDLQNKKLREHYKNNPQPKTIEYNKIEDIWDDDLEDYTQEWKYSIDSPYEGRVEDLKFTKSDLEDELRRVYLRQFRPRDPKMKPMKDILPKLPDLESMRPYPEKESSEWSTNISKLSRVILYGWKMCLIKGSRIIMKDLRYNKTLTDTDLNSGTLTDTDLNNMTGLNSMGLAGPNSRDDKVVANTTDKVAMNDTVTDRSSNPLNNEIRCVACNENDLLVSNKNEIFLIKNSTSKKILQSKLTIKDIYIDQSLIAYLTSKSIHIHDSKTLEEIKIIKLKGDSPHSIKILNNTVYASTHKGIMIDSEKVSEIKNLGYVIDFEIHSSIKDATTVIDEVYAINNVNRLIKVNDKIKSNIILNQIGSEIRINRKYNLIAILFTNEIGIYKIMGEQVIPVNTIAGAYKSIGWDEDMPWLYGIDKKRVRLFT